MKMLISLCLFLTSVNVFAVGFSQGNEFNYSMREGYVHISCSGGIPNMTSEYCRGYDVAPAASDYFVGPSNIDADTLKLVATSESGKVTSKEVDYDAAKGMSKKKINLAISTLTQKPLLKLGSNKVQYSLLKDGQEVASGEVVVNYINSGKIYQCPTKNYFSYFTHDCQSPNFCTQYFNEVSCN